MRWIREEAWRFLYSHSECRWWTEWTRASHYIHHHSRHIRWSRSTFKLSSLIICDLCIKKDTNHSNWRSIVIRIDLIKALKRAAQINICVVFKQAYIPILKRYFSLFQKLFVFNPKPLNNSYKNIFYKIYLL